MQLRMTSLLLCSLTGSAFTACGEGDGKKPDPEPEDTAPDCVPDEAGETWYDGVDGDCDGASDHDQDGDGHDRVESGGGDCDDEDAAIHPDAGETCEDGIDNDCDGSAAGCGFGGTMSPAGAAARIVGADENDAAGFSVAAAGDVDGNGSDDLIVGAYLDGSGGTSAGAAYVVFGPIAGESSLSDAGARLDGTAGEFAGRTVAGPGDFNGDGFADVLVGAQYEDSAGRDAGMAYLVFAPVAGGADLRDADLLVSGESNGDEAGSVVAAAGDADGNGKYDFLVGAAWADAGLTDNGAAYLVLGPIYGSYSLSDADARISGAAEGDRAGTAVSVAGDPDGDGVADYIVGAPSDDTGGDDAGAAYVLAGPLSGEVSLAATGEKVYGVAGGDSAGIAVAAAGDVDGDGLDDILVGAPYHDSGANQAGVAYLVLAPVDGPRELYDADAKMVGTSEDGLAGSSLCGPGDVDGDGNSDLAVGSPTDDGAGSEAGAVWVVFGPVSGSLDLVEADAVIAGGASGDRIGLSLGAAGDLDGDWFPDLLAGAPEEDANGSNAGAVYVFGGGPGF